MGKKSCLNFLLIFGCRFSLVDQEEMGGVEEVCAICWETMTTARRLPCRHLFHTYVGKLKMAFVLTNLLFSLCLSLSQRLSEAVAGAGHSLPDMSLFSEY